MRYLCFLLLLNAFVVFGQSGTFPMGARNAALGGATVSLADPWSLFNNVAGLGFLEQDFVFASYQNRFALRELQTVGVGYVRDLGSLAAGMGFYRFGGEWYNEQRFHIAAGHKLDRVALGISLNYLQYGIATVGTVGSVVVEFGGIASITDELSFGAHIFNVNQARLAGERGEIIPTVMKAGLLFQPNDSIILTVETEKDIGFAEVFRAGLEYQIIRHIYIRTGLSTEPFSAGFGFGFHPRTFQVDYAFNQESFLGSTHEVSFGYRLSGG